LPVENGGDGLVREGSELWAMRVVSLVIILHEAVKLEFAAACRLDFPEEECAERIALHQAIEQLGDLLRRPDEFPLNGGEDIVALFDAPYRISNSAPGFIHCVFLLRPVVPRSTDARC
jgi:hypothetical protein